MILSTLSTISDSLSLTFLYGEKQAFNIDTDAVDASAIVLYHEGYVSGQTIEDTQGAWENTYALRLWLGMKNTGANDKPADRDQRFATLEPLMARILSILSKDYNINQPVTFSEFINQNDTNLDGIRFVVNCKAKEAPTVYC